MDNYNSTDTLRMLIQKEAVMVYKTNRRTDRYSANFYDFFITLNKTLGLCVVELDISKEEIRVRDEALSLLFRVNKPPRITKPLPIYRPSRSLPSHYQDLVIRNIKEEIPDLYYGFSLYNFTS